MRKKFKRESIRFGHQIEKEVKRTIKRIEKEV